MRTSLARIQYCRPRRTKGGRQRVGCVLPIRPNEAGVEHRWPESAAWPNPKGEKHAGGGDEEEDGGAQRHREASP